MYNFKRWIHDTRFRIMQPHTMNRYSAALNDFGMENMFDRLMNEFICLIYQTLYLLNLVDPHWLILSYWTLAH